MPMGNMPNPISDLLTIIQPIVEKDLIGLSAVWSPPRPVIDIIFVHGLGGSSGKTWCYENDASTFWPSWLQREEELSNARVHTFGYSANIVGGANSSSLFDFAQELLFKMKNEYPNHKKGPEIGRVGVALRRPTL